MKGQKVDITEARLRPWKRIMLRGQALLDAVTRRAVETEAVLQAYPCGIYFLE